MAKKKAAASDFKMAAEIRSILTDNRSLGVGEALEALQAKFPDAKFNKNSFAMSFYGARKKLGISSGRNGATKKVVRKKVPSAVRPTVDMATLQAAVKFLTEVGDAETAIEAVKQVKTLQIK